MPCKEEQLFPYFCKEAAKSSCKLHVLDTIDYRIDDGSCADKNEDDWDKDKEGILEKCDKTVNKLAKEAGLN